MSYPHDPFNSNNHKDPKDSKNPYPWGVPYTRSSPTEYNKDHYKKSLPPVPKPLTIVDLWPRIDKWAIGFEQVFSTLNELSTEKPSYPPYNIIRDDAVGGRWEIAIAVAGFTKEDLIVTQTERTLTIETVDVERSDIREVVYQGIAQRNFKLNFALAEHVEPKSIKLEHGLLIISLETDLPEEKQPKQLDIE
jgi:molecular chaperone IbpA